MTIEALRTRSLPFSLMTTTHGLLIVADAAGNDLFTYCPQFGVMRGLGDFDNRPRMYTPKCLQLFNAPVEDLKRMKWEWEQAAKENIRHGAKPRSFWPKDALLPLVPELTSSVSPDDQDPDLRAFNEYCEAI